MSSTPAFGTHVEANDPISQAASLGIDVVQISLGDPKSWSGPEILFPGGLERLREAAEAAGVSIYIHSPFVINVASTNNRIRIPSRKLLQKHLEVASQLGAAGVIVHGGHVNQADDPKQGYENWLKAVDELTFADTPLLLENTAGGKNAMLRMLDSIRNVWEAISTSKNIANIGFCFDTCHGFTSGNDFVGLAKSIKQITGRIDLVHLNDSKGAPGSGVDRHANLGQGQIDPDELLGEWLAADAPAILETPAEGVRDDLSWLASRII